jgi:Cu(I)/Ag(I) efflux system membrane fusion protein
VDAGDELALFYSPDLLVTAQNLLDAKRAGNKEMMDSSRARLELLGIDRDQIDEILAAGKTDNHLKIRSPISGHIISKNVREGQYVQEGTPLYDLADLSTVWIQAQVYEDDLAILPVGYGKRSETHEPSDVEVTAKTRAFPNEVFHGKLAFIYPHVDSDTRTVTVRFELKNPDHKLRPGSTASVTLKVTPQELPIFSNDTGHEEQQKMLKEGRVLAVPEGSVIDTGSQKIVYRETSPGVFDAIETTLGPRMVGPGGATFYPVLQGLKQGERVVTTGSFLVDAETRLNPAAGSIYFGGSGGTQVSRSTTVRPSTPEDPDAKVISALANLSPEDRQLAEAQRFCPILPANRLGVMGTPVKVDVNGQPVFLCCSGCKEKALANPEATIAKVKALRADAAKGAVENNKGAAVENKEDFAVKAALAELSPEDRKLAEAQRFCVVLKENRLGIMGKPFKVMVDGEPVFLCCEGCKEDALANPADTVAKVRQMRSAAKSITK